MTIEKVPVETKLVPMNLVVTFTSIDLDDLRRYGSHYTGTGSFSDSQVGKLFFPILQAAREMK